MCLTYDLKPLISPTNHLRYLRNFQSKKKIYLTPSNRWLERPLQAARLFAVESPSVIALPTLSTISSGRLSQFVGCFRIRFIIDSDRITLLGKQLRCGSTNASTATCDECHPLNTHTSIPDIHI